MLEFEEDPDYDFLLNLFITSLENCDEEEPDFDWNKELKIERPEYYHAKNNDKSMLINQKSTYSNLVKGNETAYSPGLIKSSSQMMNSIFIKPEE